MSSYPSRLLQTYRQCVVSASVGLWRNWILIPAACVAYYLFVLAAMLFAPMGIAGGFILGAIGIALLSLYYSWIHETVQGTRLRWKSLTEFDTGLFFQIISVAFIFWIVLDLLLAPTIAASKNYFLGACVNLGVGILFNAIPEMLQQQRSEGMQSLAETFTFVRDNWIEWFIPLVIVLLPMLLLWSPMDALFLLTESQPLLPVFVFFQAWVPLKGYIGWLYLPLALVLAHWFMLFRAHLFDQLDGRARSPWIN